MDGGHDRAIGARHHRGSGPDHQPDVGRRRLHGRGGRDVHLLGRRRHLRALHEPTGADRPRRRPHSLAVKQTDAAGHAGTQAVTASWTVDTTTPSAPASVTAPADSTATAASVTFTGDDALPYQCSLDAGAWSTCTSPAQLSGLSVGSHTLRVRQVSAAGTASEVASATWVVVAPATGAATPAPVPVVCTSRRSIALHWRIPAHARTTAIVVTIDGKRYRRLRAAARSVIVDLSGKPAGSVTGAGDGHWPLAVLRDDPGVPDVRGRAVRCPDQDADADAAGVGDPTQSAPLGGGCSRLGRRWHSYTESAVPTYEYRCVAATIRGRPEDDRRPGDELRACGAPVQRVFHPVAVHFKGKGFYNTDYGTRRRNRELRALGQGRRGQDGVQGQGQGQELVVVIVVGEEERVQEVGIISSSKSSKKD